jgi:hypothetical protein
MGDFSLLLRHGQVLQCELYVVWKDKYKIGYTNSWCQFTQETECCTVALNICGITVWILICHPSFKRNSGGSYIFGNFVDACLKFVHFQCYSCYS